MFNKFYYQLENKKIPIHLTDRKIDFNEFLNSQDAFIITDSNLYKYYYQEFAKLEKVKYPIFVISDGESSKNIHQVEKIYQALIKFHISRDSIIYSIGGGVVGDISGFIASTFKRGIKLVHIPTTLMAMIDSSIGGKNGINFCGIKNMIGTFYSPEKIIININFLKTISNIEFHSAFSEVIKYGLLGAEKIRMMLIHQKKEIFNRQKDVLYELIMLCIKKKIEFIEKDPYDKKERIYLNLGHTFAHLIEAGSKDCINHGQSVGAGIRLSAIYSFQIGLLNKKNLDKIEGLLDNYKFLLNTSKFDIESILIAMQNDKKWYGKNLRLVLPISDKKAILYEENDINGLINFLKSN
ncbi:MAG: hypothetical protein DRH57_08970 [Candidatus Cloacimonadota bacterium]|nr:MAG: hypothetical protein DRH57_08970 [Candidatus Cloacimonadota bacterium]